MNADSFFGSKHLQRLREAQQQALHELEDKTRQWNKFKNDYIKLQKRLETLPHELKYDITVPISKNAFMPGKLVNTNEILVLMGDNWFVERSAKQACDMIGRRLKGIDEHLSEIERTKTTCSDQLNWTENVIKETTKFVNIEEKLEEPVGSLKATPGAPKGRLTDEEIRELRRKQQEKALRAATDIDKYIQDDLQVLHSKGKLPDDQDEEEEDEDEDEEEIKPDVDFTEKLRQGIEDLRIEEPSKGDQAARDLELANLMSQYSKTVDRANNEMMAKILGAQAKEPSKKKAVHFEPNELQELSRKLDRDREVSDEDDEEEDDYEDDEDEADLEGIDHEEDEPQAAESSACVIKVKHTPVEPSSAPKVLSNSSVPKIESPADIYKVFYQPKSILKVKENQSVRDESTVGVRVAQSAYDVQRSDKNKENDDNNFKFEPQKAFPGEIVEKNVSLGSSRSQPDSAQVAEKPAKPVSKFRANKTSQK